MYCISDGFGTAVRTGWVHMGHSSVETALDVTGDPIDLTNDEPQADHARADAFLNELDMENATPVVEDDDGAGVFAGGAGNSKSPPPSPPGDDGALLELDDQQAADRILAAEVELDDMAMQLALVESEKEHLAAQLLEVQSESERLKQRHVKMAEENDAISCQLQAANIEQDEQDCAIRGMREKFHQLAHKHAQTIRAFKEEQAGHKRTRESLDRARADVMVARGQEQEAKDAAQWERYTHSGQPLSAPPDAAIDLRVGYADKDTVKLRGAKWNRNQTKKVWQVPPGSSVRPFVRWVPF